jgi:ABC-type multidrug transport system ATPase subunit
MDEATASVDMENDALIQETVRSEFEKCTVATVAHRLNTVADSDVVMVLEKGVLSEMDKPAALVTREKSMFKNLIKATGEASSKHLMSNILSGKKSYVRPLQKEEDKAKEERRIAEQAERDFFRDIELAFSQSSFPIVPKTYKQTKKK